METRKEKIIEILKSPRYFLNGKVYLSDFYRIADAILALPIEVPSIEDVENKYPEDGTYANMNSRIGANWAIEEIIKRNKK